MATSLTFNSQDSKTNSPYLSSRRYLKATTHLVPLGLRRSVSLEDNSIDTDLNSLQKPILQKSSNLLIAKTSVSSSLNCLCVQLRPHQLLPEFNENIAQTAIEHEFDWWKSAAYIRPVIENIILYQNFKSEFQDDKQIEDQMFIKFTKSKRNGRRNAICCAIDRLCYNQQLILFVTIATDVQIGYNLISSGFTM